MCVDQRRHKPRGEWRDHGYSLLELSIVLVIVSILLGVVGTRYFYIQVFAEQAATEQAVGAMRSALGTKLAEHFVRGETRRIEALAASNPMDNLAQRPKNYLGVLRQPVPAAIAGGHWYFDGGRRVLVYQVRNADRVEGGARDPVRLRWVVRLQYEDRNGNKAFDSGVEQVVGVQLVPLEPYRWKR